MLQIWVGAALQELVRWRCQPMSPLPFGKGHETTQEISANALNSTTVLFGCGSRRRADDWRCHWEIGTGRLRASPRQTRGFVHGCVGTMGSIPSSFNPVIRSSADQGDNHDGHDRRCLLWCGLPLLSLRMDPARGSLLPDTVMIWQRWPALFSKSRSDVTVIVPHRVQRKTSTKDIIINYW